MTSNEALEHLREYMVTAGIDPLTRAIIECGAVTYASCSTREVIDEIRAVTERDARAEEGAGRGM